MHIQYIVLSKLFYSTLLYALIAYNDCLSAQGADSEINTPTEQNIPIVNTDNSDQRLQHIIKAGRTGQPVPLSPEDIKHIIAQTRSTNPLVVLNAQEALALYAKQYNDVYMFLNESLTSAESADRRCGISILSLMARQGDNVAAKLEAFLSGIPKMELDDSVRYSAIGAYMFVGNLDDIEKAVTLACKDEYWRVRAKAIEVAYNSYVIDRQSIRETVMKMRDNDSHEEVRRCAKDCLLKYQRDQDRSRGYRWPNDIIQEFYSVLTNQNNPTEAEEAKLCSSVKRLIHKDERYKSSKTPVWDALRANKFLFIAEGALKADRLFVSNVFGFRVLNESRPRQGRYVMVYFASYTQPEHYGKMHSVIFAINDNGGIDIDETTLGGFGGISLYEYFSCKYADQRYGAHSASDIRKYLEENYGRKYGDEYFENNKDVDIKE